MNYEDIKNMSDEEVAELNKKLSADIAKFFLRMFVVRILVVIGFNLLLKWLIKKNNK